MNFKMIILATMIYIFFLFSFAGQKFAILEIKAILVAIIKNFTLLPVTRLEDIVFENGLVLRSQQQIQIKFVKKIVD